MDNTTNTEAGNEEHNIALVLCWHYLNFQSVNPGPTVINFVMRPQNQSITQFERVEIQCSVDSTLIPIFAWNFTKRGSSTPVQIVEENVLLSSDYSFRTTIRSTILVIESAQWIHDGLYTCIVTDGCDTIQAEGSLDVLSEL